MIVQNITSGRIDTAIQVARTHYTSSDTTISARTAARALKFEGLDAVVKTKKPPLLAKHKKERLSFAKKVKHWIIDDWKRVIWSDESKINRVGKFIFYLLCFLLFF